MIVTPDLDNLLMICHKVKQEDDELEAMMKRASEREDVNLEILRQYASFQEVIMKDQAKADKIYDVIKSRKVITIAASDYDQNVKKGDDLSKISQSIVIISGMRDDFCQIVNINNAASTIFGYSKSELMGKKVEMLMSDIYARVHDSFVSNYVSSMKGLMINKERFVMAKHKTRFLIPVNIYIKVRGEVTRPSKTWQCRPSTSVHFSRSRR